MRSVLGIDAAWTEREPSGIALVADDGSGWSLIESAASYAAFLGADPTARHRGSIPDAEAPLAAAAIKTGAPLTWSPSTCLYPWCQSLAAGPPTT